jgi:6-pyruvoyltetrahydropterin/6-carboxytetrahydropterin synthase
MAEPRFTVVKEQDFAAAHYLREYQGNCEKLHGHNYRVQVHVGCNELDGEGLVLDFQKLKQAMREVIAPFDHASLNEVPPFDTMNPTCEHLARHIAEKVAKQIDDGRARVTECHVWETDRNCAVYRR